MSGQENRRIGDYEILGVLGQGGMGQVFKVRNVISDRVEAMKIILPDLAGRQDLANRFLREIKLLAGLDHPNIAALRTALTVDNQLVMIMEYVAGMTVASKLALGPLPVSDAVNYIDQVLQALGYAHQRNVIHRDIKPSNMMVTPDGVVKLMDFGIARSTEASDLTATGATLGSLYYMSPEQVKGEPTDARSDLYSVGASLYEMVTGECAFKSDSNYSLMEAQVKQAPRPPVELRANVPAALNEIILLAMAKEPARRFQTADAFRNALKSVKAEITAPSVAVAVDERRTLTTLPPEPAAAGRSPSTPAEAAWIDEPGVAVPEALPENPVAPSVIEAGRQAGGHRGRYVALGGLLVVACLVGAGLYLPRLSKMRAVAAPTQVQTTTTTAPVPTAPADTATPPPAAAADNTAPSTTTPAQDATTTGAPPANSSTPDAASAPPNVISHHKASGGTRAIRDAVEPASNTAQMPSATSEPDNAAALAELEQQVDHISARAAAVNGSLDTLRRQQAAQGLGLRGDIAAAQERVRIHLDKAEAALQNRDLDRAQKNADQAEADLETLERFLGR